MRTSWAASILASVVLQLRQTEAAFVLGPSMKPFKPRPQARDPGLSSKTLRVGEGRDAQQSFCLDGNAGEGRDAQQSATRVARFKRTRRFGLDSAEYSDGGGLEERMQRLTRILEQDLPLQYEKPQDLSCFCDTIEFEDPVTSLRGKLLYRGMLFFTLLFFRVACKPGSYFTLSSIDRPARRKIRTVWETGAVTAWNGREIFISGVDTFSVNNEGRIWRHDSAWDQTWEEVKEQVL